MAGRPARASPSARAQLLPRAGARLIAVSGHVKTPGQIWAPLTTRLRQELSGLRPVLIRRSPRTERPFPGGHVILLRAFRQDPQTTKVTAEETLALAEKYVLPLYQACARVLRGWARSALGERDGLADLEERLAAFRQTGTKMFSHFFAGLLADARIRAGRLDEALEAIKEGLAEVDAVGSGTRRSFTGSRERCWRGPARTAPGMRLRRSNGPWSWPALRAPERSSAGR